jgi:hypothetical protein
MIQDLEARFEDMGEPLARGLTRHGFGGLRADTQGSLEARRWQAQIGRAYAHGRAAPARAVSAAGRKATQMSGLIATLVPALAAGTLLAPILTVYCLVH